MFEFTSVLNLCKLCEQIVREKCREKASELEMMNSQDSRLSSWDFRVFLKIRFEMFRVRGQIFRIWDIFKIIGYQNRKFLEFVKLALKYLEYWNEIFIICFICYRIFINRMF